MAAALQKAFMCAPKLGESTPPAGVLRGILAGYRWTRSFGATRRRQYSLGCRAGSHVTWTWLVQDFL